MTYSLPISVVLPEKYNKVTDIYTRMAIYLDLHIYDENRNDTVLYQYVYHLCYMLACKARYFHKFEDYDGFAISAATRVYLRLISKDHQDDENKIVSVLNYIKSLLYPMKVDYQNENFDQIINPKEGLNTDSTLISSNIKSAIQSDYNEGLQDEIIHQFGEIPKYIWKVINDSPYRRDKLLCKRLYMSILLSTINGLTLSNSNMDKLVKKEERTNVIDDELLLSMIEQERESSTILWRLDDDMEDIVKLLTTKVRKIVTSELMETKRTYELDDDEMTAIIMSAYETDSRDVMEND